MKRRLASEDFLPSARIDVECEDLIPLGGEGHGGRQPNGPETHHRETRHIAS
jgi:hypothetical protein